MDLPTVNGPKDLPDLRRWLLKRVKPNGSLVSLDGKFIHSCLSTGDLWWVEEETCHLLADSAPTLPDDLPLDFSKIPTKAGFAVLAHNIEGLDAVSSDVSVRISAICWGPVQLPPLPGEDTSRPAIGIGMFTRLDLHDGLAPEDMFRAATTLLLLSDESTRDISPRSFAGKQELRNRPDLKNQPAILSMQVWTTGHEGTLFAYVGRTDWVGERRIDELVEDAPRFTELAQRSMMEDRKLLAALWAITQTPIVSLGTVMPSRPVARRAQRDGLDAAVRVLRLGMPTTPTNGPSAAPQDGSAPAWKHSWVVRPHWVWQPYGPKQSQRKLILRGPFRKGPDDKPLLGAERVWKVVAPPIPKAAQQ